MLWSNHANTHLVRTTAAAPRFTVKFFNIYSSVCNLCFVFFIHQLEGLAICTGPPFCWLMAHGNRRQTDGVKSKTFIQAHVKCMHKFVVYDIFIHLLYNDKFCLLKPFIRLLGFSKYRINWVSK